MNMVDWACQHSQLSSQLFKNFKSSLKFFKISFGFSSFGIGRAKVPNPRAILVYFTLEFCKSLHVSNKNKAKYMYVAYFRLSSLV